MLPQYKSLSFPNSTKLSEEKLFPPDLTFLFAGITFVSRPNGNPIIVNYLPNAAQTPNCTNLKKIGKGQERERCTMLKNLSANIISVYFSGKGENLDKGISTRVPWQKYLGENTLDKSTYRKVPWEKWLDHSTLTRVPWKEYLEKSTLTRVPWQEYLDKSTSIRAPWTKAPWQEYPDKSTLSKVQKYQNNKQHRFKTLFKIFIYKTIKLLDGLLVELAVNILYWDSRLHSISHYLCRSYEQ